ncbi:putative glycosyltransferase EpsJ [Chryseobacterium aquaeductus]|uniref:Glycosyltransferase EpsJ n=1 Tax=Chryseobacterium aquaeductus TaxID=2675056 RepID=A0A9N8MI33_9FLAO|nr:glycosyltransferase family 2 protein [Chryseobacterium aquaeductus]CAA7331607.1 putative glycosyltransferase EpsJ [Chryseobacterium potabilaquae]CAD7811218.1 putative glycosyltransferase EpsJ [Chryseobacterium aquaeductus]
MRISVVIPMYNAEKTIVNVLDSVQTQSYLPIEIIIVNDGSTDNSLKIVQDYMNKHIAIPIHLINKKNGGVSSARNLGMKKANGDWIALLDSDDVWLPHKLERQKQILEAKPHIDFLGTTRNDEIIKSILWKKLGNLSKITPKNLMVKFVFVVPTVLFKREIVSSIGYFDENQKHAEEGNYFIRIANKKNCYLLNESLVITGGGKAHFGESGLSGNILEMEKGELKNIKYAYIHEIINFFEYITLSSFSLFKFLRRWIIVKTK